jgi:soluble lytic murein transglycosylase-like protein
MLDILTAILIASATNHVDPLLVAAVVQVESKFNTQTVGALGEIGLMQLRPEFFAPKQPGKLFNADTNINIGVKYLKLVESRCRHKLNNTFVVCYNAGIAGGSRLLDPGKFSYYKRVSKEYDALKRENVFKKFESGIFIKIAKLRALKNERTNFSYLSSRISSDGAVVPQHKKDSRQTWSILVQELMINKKEDLVRL